MYTPGVEVLEEAVEFHTSCPMKDDRAVIGSTLTAIIQQSKHVPEKGRLVDEEVAVYPVETVLDLRHGGISSSVMIDIR